MALKLAPAHQLATAWHSVFLPALTGGAPAHQNRFEDNWRATYAGPDHFTVAYRFNSAAETPLLLFTLTPIGEGDALQVRVEYHVFMEGATSSRVYEASAASVLCDVYEWVRAHMGDLLALTATVLLDSFAKE